MALFLDGPPSGIEDLTNQDSGLLEVCRTEQINTTVKLCLAHDEVSMELEALFERQRNCNFPRPHPALDLPHLAVTPSLKAWHTFQTLSLIYRDAYFSQLNDRFQAKWDEFQGLANRARNRFQELGAGLVYDPLPRPQQPLLSSTPATETGGTFYLAMTWVNSESEESSPSIPQSYALPDGNAVDIQPVSAPANALGWNVYAGANPEAMYLQDTGGAPTDGDWIFYPSAAVTTGMIAGAGQAPNFIRALPRLLQRG